jgi:hypothetical protein
MVKVNLGKVARSGAKRERDRERLIIIKSKIKSIISPKIRSKRRS